ncbi:hypothetical protein ACA910_008639 [Epithemia clementina (nom. ined.)]
MTKDNPSPPTAVQSETTSHVSQESATRVTDKQETSTESSTDASSLSSNVDGAHENVTSESSGRPPSKPSRKRKKKKRRRHRDPKPAPVPNPKTLLPGIPERRSERYPSVEERVRIYMGAWYLPPCKKDDDEADSNNMSTIIYYQYNYTKETVILTTASRNEQGRAQRPPLQEVPTTAGPRLFFAKQSNYDSCRRTYKHISGRYIKECQDVQRTIPRNLLWSKEDRKAEVELRLNSALRNTTSTQTLSQPPPPILLRIDDRGHPQKVPTFHYCRKAFYNGEIDDLTKKRTCSSAATGKAMIEPIVWNLYSSRYFGPLYKVANEDRDWNDKIDAAVFRGAITGGPASSDELLFGSDPEINRRFEAESNDTAKCLQIPRCRLVYFYANSTRINAGLTEHKLAHEILKDPTNVSGVNLLAPGKESMNEQLKYKMLIFIDGNDMASGLKWGLLSRSVVMMPRTRYTSYAMDELMRPFVHYVPLKHDLSNVEEIIQWVLDHDEEAQQIAHRGSLWIQDLVFHPDAERDNELIRTEILERYSAHFAPLPTTG